MHYVDVRQAIYNYWYVILFHIFTKFVCFFCEFSAVNI